MRLSRPGVLEPTPLVAQPALGVGIKDERVQPPGSFKARGALGWVRANPGRGPVVTGSSGNHGLALKWALERTGDDRPLIVVVTATADLRKVGRLRAAGCVVEVAGGDNSRRDAHARALAEATGGLYCSSHDDDDVIAGQGSLAAEIRAQTDGPVTLFVPVGGGGLFAGSLQTAAVRPGMEVVGVEPAGACAMARSLAAGQLVELDAADTIADALRAVRPGPRCFAIARQHRARVVVVDDDAIARAHACLDEALGPTEVSAAVALAGAWAMPAANPICVVTA